MTLSLLIVLQIIDTIYSYDCTGFGDLCQSCSRLECQYCASGYIDSKGICVYLSASMQSVDNCFFFKNRYECIQCIYGYYTTYDGLCEKFDDENCAIGYKKDCNYHFGKLSRYGNVINQKCKVKNCELCSRFRDSEICYLCTIGYVLITSKGKSYCQTATGPMIGCLQTFDSISCEICDVFYVKSGTLCVEDRRADNTYKEIKCQNLVKVLAGLILLLLIL